MDNINLPFSEDIKLLLTHYNFDFSQAKISPLGNGHINSTYKLSTPDAEFVLQRINHEVFPLTLELCNNAQLINQHLMKQSKKNAYPLLVPQQLLCKEGDSAVRINGNYWRLMDFLKDSHTLEEVSNPEQAAQVAQAFAQFSGALSDFPIDKLTVIIEDFHDISFRMKQLKEAVSNNLLGRLDACQDIVAFFFSQQDFIDHVIDISKKLPMHVTHNDTKINNLLFNSLTNLPCAVIDLDTCMPGLLMHDFGDMVRTCCSNLAEDDTSTNEMVLNIEIFAALINSYQQAFGDKITSLEKQSLIIGARLLPFIIGTRFLTDHLNGDNYFHVSRENHNLDRAKSQIQLYNLVSKAEPELQQYIQ